MNDAVIRSLAVLAAAALLAAPYWRDIARAVTAAAEAARARAATIARVAAAGLIVAAAWGKVPLPTLAPAAAPTVEVETPDAEMQSLVKPIAAELAKLPLGDRVLWASTWNKAAIVVSGDTLAKEPAFTTTRSLQMFTALALDIAWRRIGAHPPGNEPLRKALEAAYAAGVGTDEVPVTRDVRDRYAAFAKAVAWAGMNGG